MIQIVLIIILVLNLINLLLKERILYINNRHYSRIIIQSITIIWFKQISINFLNHKCKYLKVKSQKMDKVSKLKVETKIKEIVIKIFL